MNALNPINEAEAETIVATQKVAQDWETLVSPGHVIGHRVQSLGPVSMVAGILFAAGAIYAATVALDPWGPRIAAPDFIVGMLTVDPNTYVDLGNGQKASYRLAWLNSIPRERGMDVAGWTALVGAVQADARQFGYNPTEWTQTAELEVGPQITRPSKAFTDHADKLGRGVVAIPEDGSQTLITGFVEGSWAIASLDPWGQCGIVFGPAVEGCQTIPAEYAANEIEAVKPALQTQE